MLIDAGADPLVRDCFGKNLLWNAVERSDPGMIGRLLELGLDPTENDATGNPFEQTKKHKPTFSVAEHMIWANYSRFIYWQVIGPPDETDFVRCFLMLLDHGADFKPPPALLRETKVKLGNLEVSSIKPAPDDDERARASPTATQLVSPSLTCLACLRSASSYPTTCGPT